jgi:hypothetical protein
MAISNLTSNNIYDGDGSTLGPYAITFDYFDQNDIVVFVDGVLKALGTHYTIVNGSTSKGHFTSGDLTFTAGNEPSGDVGNIYIACDTKALQPIDVSALNSFNEDQVEQYWDRLALVARDAKERANSAVRTAAADLEAAFQAYVAACQAAQAAAEAAETNAEAAEANAIAQVALAEAQVALANTARIAAELAATNSANSASASQLSALNAAAIAAGALFTFVNVSGSVTAVNNGQYIAANGTAITCPTPGANVSFQVINNANGWTSGISLISAGKKFNGLNSPQTIVDNGLYTVAYDGDVEQWVVYPGSSRNYGINPAETITEITDDYTLLETTKTIYATITSQKTVTLYPATGAGIHRIRNNATSTGNLVIQRAGSNTIDSGTGLVTSVTLYPGQGVSVQSTGSGWILL